VYRANPDVIETDLGEELILLDPRTQEMFSLNATGRAVWRALPAPDEAAIAAAVAESFDISPARAEADVRTLLQQLAEAGLVLADDGEQRP
jgi:PqqD family protein of HPr-rel-A system